HVHPAAFSILLSTLCEASLVILRKDNAHNLHCMTNYFELYNIPVSFHPDQVVVKNKYYELSRQYHPDRFAQAGGTGMVDALHMASINNTAYKTLRDSDAT